MGNGHTARGRLPVLCQKGGGALSAHRPDREVCGCGGQVWLCCVVLWWECAKGPFLFGMLHPSPTLVWGARWPVPSDLFGQCPTDHTHSPQWTWHLPMPAPFNVNSFRFLSALPDSCQQRLQWAGVLIQEGRHNGYSTLLASLATFLAGCEARLSFSPSPPTRPLDLGLDSHPSRKDSTDGGHLLEGLDATGLPLPQFRQVPEPPDSLTSTVPRTDDGRRTPWLDTLRPRPRRVQREAPTTSPSVAIHPRRLLAVYHPAVGVPRPTSTVSLSILPSRRHATMVPPRDRHALTCHRAAWPAATSLGNPGLHYRCPALRAQFLRRPPSVPSAVPLISLPAAPAWVLDDGVLSRPLATRAVQRPLPGDGRRLCSAARAPNTRRLRTHPGHQAQTPPVACVGSGDVLACSLAMWLPTHPRRHTRCTDLAGPSVVSALAGWEGGVASCGRLPSIMALGETLTISPLTGPHKQGHPTGLSGCRSRQSTFHRPPATAISSVSVCAPAVRSPSACRDRGADGE